MKANQAKEFEKNDYGVFLNADASSLERFKMYETIVIDAQYFTKRDIELLHQNGTVVYTYLNIGSIENFREYYTTYAELAIGEYEHWEEEQWVDVAKPDWQKFIGQLSQELYEKGVDGFFIDNCDVYDYDPHESIFEGITAILQNMMTFGKAGIIKVLLALDILIVLAALLLERKQYSKKNISLVSDICLYPDSYSVP